MERHRKRKGIEKARDRHIQRESEQREGSNMREKQEREIERERARDRQSSTQARSSSFVAAFVWSVLCLCAHLPHSSDATKEDEA